MGDSAGTGRHTDLDRVQRPLRVEYKIRVVGRWPGIRSNRRSAFSFSRVARHFLYPAPHSWSSEPSERAWWLALCPLPRHPVTVMQTNAVRALTGRLAAILRRSGGIGPRRHGACFGTATNMPLAPLSGCSQTTSSPKPACRQQHSIVRSNAWGSAARTASDRKRTDPELRRRRSQMNKSLAQILSSVTSPMPNETKRGQLQPG